MLALSIGFSFANADDFVVDGHTYTIMGTGESPYVTLKEIANGTTGTFVIPDVVQYDNVTYRVTSVGFHASYYAKITKLVIGANVYSTANYAFEGCSSLKEIDFGSNTFFPGSGAFKGCGFETLTIPANVQLSSSYSEQFSSCRSLTSLTVEGTQISKSCFAGCSSLTEISMPEVTTIGKQAFQGCSSLIEVAMPKKLKALGASAFNSCTSLRIVRSEADPKANSMYSLTGSDYAQPHNDKLHIYVPDDLYATYVNYKWDTWGNLHRMSEYPAVIGDLAYVLDHDNHTATATADFTRVDPTITAESITVPATIRFEDVDYAVTAVADGTFKGSSCQSIVISEGIRSIGREAFRNCTSLTSVSLPSTLTDLGILAFDGCSALTSIAIPGSLTTIPDYGFQKCTSLKTVTVGNGTTTVGHKAFSNCSALTSAPLPASVTTVRSQGFYGCSSLLTAIKDCRLTEVGDSAFYYCNAMTDPITVAGTVGKCAFYEGGYYRGSVYPEVITLEGLTTIGDLAFSNLKHITELDLPASLLSIGSSGFAKCTSLTKITMRGTIPPSITSTTFSDCSGITVYVPGEALADYKAATGWKALNIQAQPVMYNGIAYAFDSTTNTATVIAGEYRGYSGDIVIPEIVNHKGTDYDVIAIDENAFLHCDGVTSITLPSSVTKVGNGAFQGTSITTIDLSYVTDLGETALAGCISLTSAKLYEYITKIPNSTFYKCVSLRSFDIPQFVTEIGMEAFMGAGLEAVMIPPIVRSLNPMSFAGCENLKIVHFPTGLRTIGEYAFDGDRELKVINWYDSEEYEDDPDKPVVNAPNRRAAAIDPADLTYHLTTIGSGAFYRTGLTYFYIPRTVEKVGLTIGGYCFEETAIARLDVAAVDLPTLDEYGFSEDTYNTALIFVPETKLADYKADASWGKFKGYPNANDTQMFVFADEEQTQVYYAGETDGNAAGTYSVPDVVTDGKNKYEVVAVAASALKDTDITSVELPSSVVSYGNSAFEGCQSLASVSYRPSGSAPVIAKVKKSQILKPAKAEAVLVESSLGKNAFHGCTSLTNVVLPEGITSIPENAFRDCTSLTEFEIPENVTAIGEGAFQGSSIKSVVIPANIYNVGARAFKNCTSLTSVSLPSTLSELQQQSFMGCTSLEHVTIPANIGYIASEAFAGDNLKSVTCLATSAPWVDNENAFSKETYSRASLYVPESAIDEYRSANVWSKFNHLDVTTSLPAIEIDAANADTSNWEYFTLQGRKVTHPTAGIYIRIQGTKAEKIAVK